MPLDSPPAIIIAAPDHMSCKDFATTSNWPPEWVRYLCPNWSQDTLTDEDRKAGSQGITRDGPQR
jgi:hypothetical protein